MTTITTTETKLDTALGTATLKTCNIEDWVNKHRIPHILIDIKYVEDGAGKLVKDKAGLKTPEGWQTWDYDKCIEYNKRMKARNGMTINVGAVGMAVIDTDSDEAEKTIQDLNLKLPITRTKKGCHRYFNVDEKYKAHRGDKIDLITVNIFEKRNRTIKYSDNLRTLKPEFLEDLYMIKLQKYGEKKVKIIQKKTGETELSTKAQSRMNFSDYDTLIEESKLRKLVDSLDPNLFTPYSMWWSFICAIYNQVPNDAKNLEYFNIATDFLKQIPNYNTEYDGENRDVWFLSLPKSDIPDDEKVKSGTLLKWLRQQNPDAYNEFRVRNSIDPPKFNSLKDYKKQKKEFEKYCFKVNSIPAFVVIDKETMEERMYKKGDFAFRWERLFTIDEDDDGKRCPFTKLWMSDQYGLEYDNMDFIPPYLNGKPTRCPDYTYNMFTGLQAEKVYGKKIDISLIYQHIAYLCEENPEVFTYVMKYMSNMVRYTGRRPNVCLVFVSEEGVGKNMLWEWFGREILGEQYFCVSANADDFLGKFSTLDTGKLLSILNEAMGKDTFKGDHRMKEKITDTKTGLEKKGVDRIQINNCNSWIMFSNQGNCAKVDWGNRRHMVVNCSSKPLTIPNYFVELKKLLDNPDAVYTFYRELMDNQTWDCIDYDFKKERVFTKAYYEMRANNIPHLARFLKSYSEKWNLLPLKSYDFYNRYKTWAEEKNESTTTPVYSETKFLITVGQIEGVYIKKDGRHQLVRFDESGLFEYVHKYYKDLDSF